MDIFINVILSAITTLISIFGLVQTEFIKNIFKKKVLATQANYKKELQKEHNKFTRDLETYKTNLLLEFEKQKLNLDITRSTQVEINQKKIIVYQGLIADLSNQYTIMAFHNTGSPLPEGTTWKAGWGLIERMNNNAFFFSNNETNKIFGKIALSLHSLMSYVVDDKLIPNEKLQLFNNLICELRTCLMEELTAANIIDATTAIE